MSYKKIISDKVNELYPYALICSRGYNSFYDYMKQNFPCIAKFYDGKSVNMRRIVVHLIAYGFVDIYLHKISDCEHIYWG